MREPKQPPGPASAARGAPTGPLGRLAVCTGGLPAICERFERTAAKAWFTRKVSVLLPVQGFEGDDERRVSKRFQLQQVSYELAGVPVAALGDQAFADAVREREICCLSRGRCLGAGNVLAVLPPGELVASVDGPTFQRLGLEEPAAGASGLRRPLLPGGHRHLRVGLGISKTRRRRAAAASEEPVSRWRSLAPPQELCALKAYCGREGADAYSFTPLLGPGTTVRRTQVPVALRRIRLGPCGGETAARPPFESIVCGPTCWSEVGFGAVCEELLDWLGGLHLGLTAAFEEPARAEARGPSAAPAPWAAEEEAWLWSMGESLLGPPQVRHTLRSCLEALDAGCCWFLISLWGTEDAPVSHHGGAHGFDLSGVHHVHLLAVRSVAHGGGCQCLLLEAANTLHSVAN